MKRPLAFLLLAALPIAAQQPAETTGQGREFKEAGQPLSADEKPAEAKPAILQGLMIPDGSVFVDHELVSRKDYKTWVEKFSKGNKWEGIHITGSKGVTVETMSEFIRTCEVGGVAEASFSTEDSAPPAGTKADAGPAEIVVDIAADGSVAVGKKKLTRDELSKRLADIAKVHKRQPVRLRGEAKCPYQTIVEIIDLCQKAGIWKTSFAAPEAPAAK